MIARTDGNSTSGGGVKAGGSRGRRNGDQAGADGSQRCDVGKEGVRRAYPNMVGQGPGYVGSQLRGRGSCDVARW